MQQNVRIDVQYESMKDATLVQRILTRDEQALRRFYQTYAPQLKRFIDTKVGSHEDADEILQDTLYAFLEGIRDYRGESSIRTYIFVICRRKVADYYRKKKIKSIVFSQTPKLEAFVTPLLNPEEALDAAILKEQIHEALSQLVPRYQDVLIWKYIDELPVRTIATRLSITLKAAEMRLFRARKAFVHAFVSL